jgi:hypothetical protein
MKKGRTSGVEDMRAEYRKSDFPGGLVRGKYAARLAAGSQVVVLEPEIAAAFPDSRAVNAALGMVLRAAQSAQLARSTGRRTKSQPKRRPTP